ncbi:hypothetical protein C0J52_01656 [Blattella germanica]|nr:hypothetical protein C0J52_01656 [Blattella germanica]
MASGASSLDSTGSNGTLSRGYTVSNSDRSLSSTSVRDYDGLKQQCDKAMHELQLLRRQHSETIRRCDHTMKELEYYRGQHRAAMNQLEANAQESSSLRSKYADLATDKQRLERDVQSLQKELTELRCQQQEEVARLKKQCDEVAQERNAAIRERNGLKQQCTSAIRQWDIALRERNEYREALAKVQQQHEEAVKEINQAMAVRMKASKDLKRLTEERNAAMQEYTLIMSERDTVHKEMEKLSDDLTQAFKKNKTLEVENKDFVEEKKALSYQIETLKREIASALHDRDKALKECNDLREKFGEYTAKEESTREGLKSRLEYNSYSRERDNSREDQTEVLKSTRDMYGKSQKERMDNLDQANQEIDRIRKQLDKFQVELQEATQEAEVSKRRRDWAFSERDKIVLERESIRTLCDKLRKERDRAVSDLAEALRDSDDIKKQRNEASKELKDLKEKMEAEQEKENRMQQFRTVGHNHSHDSAIDADLQEWETEILDIDLSGLASDDDLGFDLVGGRDDPHYPNDSGIYVASITKGSVADGKLKNLCLSIHRPNDCISRVNNLDCSNVSKRMVIETVRSSGGVANMVIRRRRMGGRCLYTTQLHVNLGEHGLTLETGIYICKINPGSLAAKEGNLAVGDRVLSINNKPMDGLKSAREAMAIMDEPCDILTITTLKGSTSPVNSNSSGQILTSEEDRGFISSSSNSSKPAKKTNQRMVNSCSQTEEERLLSVNNHGTTEEYMSDKRYLTSAFGVNERGVYKVNKSPMEKHSNSGAWDMIRGKIEFFGGRRLSKERNRDSADDKKHHRNSSPNNFERERDDAIAELDSVIDSISPIDHRKTSGSGLKRRRRGKELEKNGGTWPKARNGPMIEHGTGTILHPRKHKERLPLSELLNNPPKYPPDTVHYSEQSSRPVSIAHDRAVSCAAPSSYKTSETNTLMHFNKSGGLLCTQKSFTPTPFKDLMCENKSSQEFNRDRERDRLSGLAPSDGSIDFSVKSGNIGKELLEYYAKKKSSKYPPSDSESNISPVESLTPSLPSHSRIHSQLYGVPATAVHSSLVRSLPHYPFTPFQLAHPHPHPHSDSMTTSLPARYPSPTHLPSSQSGESIGLPDSRSYCFEPPYSPTPQINLLNHWAYRSRVWKVAEYLCLLPFVLQGNTKFNVLKVGDQLLEVCGINMRSATYQLAANVLRQCGNSITMLVQYSPDKYNELDGSVSSSSDDGPSRSGSPTPCNSPKTPRKPAPLQLDKLSPSAISGLRAVPQSSRGTLTRTRNQIAQAVSTLQRQNATVRTGDQILEYNGTDLRHATAEEAAYELAKPADKVTVLAQYSLEPWLVDEDGQQQQCGIIPSKYKRSLGDLEADARRGSTSARRSFFRRKKHQRSSSRDSKELASFSNINLGWYSDSGTLNEEVALCSYQRVERLDYPVFRPVLIVGPLSDCVMEKLIQDFPDKFTRCIPEVMHCPQNMMEKGISENIFVDFRKKGSNFECTTVTAVKEICDKVSMVTFMNVFFWSKWQWSTCKMLNSNCFALQNSHCILDISLASVERLHRHQIYPIVLLIKFKSTKQIKEVKDTRYPMEKVSAKAAKEMYEHALKLESEYRNYISALIPAGVNVAYMCTQIKAAVDHEQNKTLWVPCGAM